MKNSALIALTAVAILSFIQSNATVRRVGYFGTPTAIDYQSLQNAHDAASPGDTIYLYPGSWGNVNWSKKLTLLGYGYFLTGAGSNPGLQNITAGLSVTIYLGAGSDSSVFDGLDGFSINNNNFPNGGVSTAIVIKHCNIANTALFNASIVSWQIKQSVICVYSGGYFYLPDGNNGYLATNLQVSNCIITSTDNWSGPSVSDNGQFVNCIFPSGCNMGNNNFLMKNCIFSGGSIGGSNNLTYMNCISNSDNSSTLPTGNGNVNVSFKASPVWVVNSSNDNYALASGSPAKGAGAGGVDCGIFGGTNPYVLSGLASIPAFYLLTAPSTNTSTNPYTITFSVQSH